MIFFCVQVIKTASFVYHFYRFSLEYVLFSSCDARQLIFWSILFLRCFTYKIWQIQNRSEYPHWSFHNISPKPHKIIFIFLHLWVAIVIVIKFTKKYFLSNFYGLCCRLSFKGYFLKLIFYQKYAIFKGKKTYIWKLK